MRPFTAFLVAVAIAAADGATLTSELKTSMLPPMDEVLENGPSCVWKLPSKIQDTFSVFCVIPSPAVISMRRELCVKPHGARPEPPRNLSTSEQQLNRLILYKANGTYDPSQVGMYLLTILSDGVQSPFPQLILPVVRIEANRRQRRSVDMVTCIVEGDFVHGNLSLLVNDRPVLNVPAESAGDYVSPDGRKRVTVTRTNDTVRFRIRLPTTRVEKRYICQFLVPSCVVPAASEPLTLSSKAVSIESHYLLDNGAGSGPRVARLCCRYGGPHPESIIWGRSTDCTNFEPVTQYVRNGYNGYILGHEEFISKMDTRPRWESQVRYNVTYCLSSIADDGLRLPPGDYQCLVRNEYGVAYENSITIPSLVNISVRVEGPRVHIGCSFHYRTRGRLDIERTSDRGVVYTLLLDDDLGPDADPLSRILVNGSKVYVEATLDEVLLPDSFRCRVSDRCEVKFSETFEAMPRQPLPPPPPPPPSQKKPDKIIDASRNPHASTNQTLNPMTLEQLRRWSYVTSTTASMFIMAVFIAVRFY